ncbi:DDE-type integrase/transposase/recombinase [Orrella marina]|nr:DDE-type integrase/transposase/recombinase [Orrella marina]
MAIQLIDEAVQAGARYAQACNVLGLSCRTLRRWHQDTDDLQDKRGRVKRIPSHALTDWEKRRILEVANQPAYKSLPPSQIVPKLADRDIYIASESSFYRVLKEHGQNNHRGKAQPVRKVPKPAPVVARAPNTAWSWDITFLPTQIRGQFLRLYMMIDVYSRNIVGWEIHEDERSEHAARLMEKACLKHQIKPDQLILHSDNGSPMKGATMLATLQRLGVVPSFSRPSVSDDILGGALPYLEVRTQLPVDSLCRH